jgi:hypothetical protein
VPILATMADRDEELTFAGTTNLDRLTEIHDDRHREAIERGIDLGLEAAASVQDRTISTFSRSYQPAFAGISTFLKAPYLEDVKQVGGHDVAIVGAPFDMGMTFRPGLPTLRAFQQDHSRPALAWLRQRTGWP